MCECKKNDKYQVCLPSHHKTSSVLHSFQMILFYLDSFWFLHHFQTSNSRLPSRDLFIAQYRYRNRTSLYNKTVSILKFKRKLRKFRDRILRKVIIFKGLCERCQIKLQGIMFLLESIVRLVISYSTFELLVHSNNIYFKITDNQMQ